MTELVNGYPANHRANARRWRQALKEQVYDHYGRVCACCGETEPLFLTIDHIGDDGAEHRRTNGTGGGRLYRLIVQEGFPDTYQVLCLNCNRGRWLNGGVCPHKTHDRSPGGRPSQPQL